MTLVAFISGPTDTDYSYFYSHYVPHIQAAIVHGDHFVLGPLACGVDADALDYLLTLVTPERIRVFMTHNEDRMRGIEVRAQGVQVQVVGETSQERDAALTRASTYDILRVRPRNEARAFYGRLWSDQYVTNTERNWKRRRGIAELEPWDPEEINRSIGAIRESSIDLSLRRSRECHSQNRASDWPPQI